MQSIESEGSVDLKQSRLHYFKYGTGKEVLLLFHGFGQDHSIFNRSIAHIIEDFSIYSFDLFYHGKSDRPNALMNPTEWIDCIRLFLEKEQIDHFRIGAYSLGGRFALQVIKHFPDRIHDVLLMAPDGFYHSPFYKAAVRLRPIFRFLMYHPTAFDSFLSFASQRNLVNKSLVKFSKRELKDPDNRIRVYRSWTYFQKLYLSRKELRATLTDKHFTISFYLGSQDYIIPPGEVMKTIGSIKNLHIDIMEKRHHEVVEEAFIRHFQ